MDKLKPCPFCGTDVNDRITQSPNMSSRYKNGHGSFYFIECPTCGIKTRAIYSYADVGDEYEDNEYIENKLTTMWNSRS